MGRVQEAGHCRTASGDGGNIGCQVTHFTAQPSRALIPGGQGLPV